MEEPKAEIPGYRFVKKNCLMVILNTSMKSYDFICRRKNGDPIPGNPTEDGGTTEKKDIPGYDFVKTVEQKMEIHNMSTRRAVTFQLQYRIQLRHQSHSTAIHTTATNTRDTTTTYS